MAAMKRAYLSGWILLPLAAAILAAIASPGCNSAASGPSRPGDYCSPCGPNSSNDCRGGLHCNGTLCIEDDQTHCSPGGGPQGNCLPCGSAGDCTSGDCLAGICTGGAAGGGCDNDSQCGGGNAPGFSAFCFKSSGKPVGACVCYPTGDGAVPDAQSPADSSADSAADACAGPTITSFSPVAGLANDPMTITGTHLGGMGATVNINGAPGTITQGDDSTLTVLIPASSGSGPVEVVAPCGSVTSTKSFGYRSYTNTVPLWGLPGTKVTISGTFLGGTSATVQFVGVTATLDPSSSETALVATIPVGAANVGPLTVQNGPDVLTTVGQFSIMANISMTCTSTGGGGTNVGDTWPSLDTIHMTGATSASFDSAGFRNDLFTAVPGTLTSNRQCNVSGPAQPPHQTEVLTLAGTVAIDGTGSGTGSETTALGTVTFTWTSVPR